MALHIIREDPFFSALPFDSFFDDEHWDLFTLFRDNLQNHRKRAKQRGADQAKKLENKDGVDAAASDDHTKKATISLAHPAAEMHFQNPLAIGVMTSDLIETDKSFVVYLDLPGVKAEDLDVTIQESTGTGGSQHNVLTIAAERKQPYLTSTPPPATSDEAPAEKSTESAVPKLHSQERLYGKVLRRVRLPLTADCEKTTVQLKDGVLMVTLGKKELAMEKKRKLTIHTD
ncbi:Hsp20/alpha crystallin family protein [archaeon]|nr:MAG: Hsp20/alpha crystallin family protein [archaeon]